MIITTAIARIDLHGRRVTPVLAGRVRLVAGLAVASDVQAGPLALVRTALDGVFV